MFFKLFETGSRIVMDESKEGDGGSSGDGAGGEKSGDENNGKKQDDVATKIEAYRPEGLPDHLFGTDDKITIDNVFKAYKGAREELSGKKAVPAKIDDYKIELPDEVSSKIIRPGADGKDPAWEHMRGVFHKMGISGEHVATIVSEFASTFGGENSGESADFSFTSLGGAEKAQVMIDGHRTFLSGLKQSGKLSEKAAADLELMTYYSEGLETLNELRVLLGDKPIPPKMEGSGSGSGVKTQEDLNAMMKDERYWRDGKKDPAFIAEVTAGFQALYKTENSA